MPERDSTWRFSTTTVSANRRGSRTAVPREDASLILGIDGNSEGCLRPSTGFKRLIDMDYGYGTDDDLVANNGLYKCANDKEVFPFTARIGSTKYMTGYVKRSLNDTQDKAVYRLILRIGNETTWRTDVSFLFTAGLIAPESYAGEQMDVVTFGRFVYVFRAGKQPFYFYVEESGGGYNLIVQQDTGPGLAPTLTTPLQNSAGAVTTVGCGRTANQDVTDVLTPMTPPSVGDADGRVLFWGFSDLQIVQTPAPPAPPFTQDQNPNLKIRNVRTTNACRDTALNGPSELGLWASPPQPNPSFGTLFMYVNGVPQTPTWPGPLNYGEREGWAWRGRQADNEPIAIETPEVWAYQLFDTRTGRQSPISNRLEAWHDGYGDSGWRETITGSAGGLQSNAGPITFPMLQLIYRHAKYDTIRFYRGRRTSPELNPSEIVMSLEKEVPLNTYHIDSQPVDTNWKVAAIFPSLTEQELSLQDTFVETTAVEGEMPYAGSALLYEGGMLFGKHASLDGTTGGLATVTWSDLNSINPEVVPASNKYPLQMPDEEIERFCRLGPNVVGFSRLAQYLVRRETQYIKVMPMHINFGVAGARGACEVGSDVYYLTESGLNVVSQNGALQDLNIINKIITEEWATNLNRVSMAYDGAAGVLFMLNPSQERIVALWLRRSRMSEFVDATFRQVIEGDIPFDGNPANRFQRRAVFVQSAELNSTDTTTRLMYYDYTRSKGTVMMMDIGGALTHNVESYTSGSDTIHLGLGVIPTFASNLYLYVLTGPNAGRKIKVRYFEPPAPGSGTGTGVPVLDVVAKIEPVNFNLSEVLVSLSPVYFEWIGSMIGINPDADALADVQSATDFFATRHVESIQACFSDVQLTEEGLPTIARYQAAVYRGTEDQPLQVAFPETTATRELVQSIEDGPSRNVAAFGDASDSPYRLGVSGAAMFPAIRIFTAGVDYRLLSVVVKGQLREPDSLRPRE